MKRGDCPGLKWRKRKNRLAPVWCAPAAAIKAGFNIRTWDMSWCAKEDLPMRCQMIWKEAMDFIGGNRDPLEYAGTVASLMNLYTRHPASPFQRVKASTADAYHIYIGRIVEAYGRRRIARLTGLDVMRWHGDIQGGEGKRHLAAAAMAISILKAALGFGQLCGFADCARLRGAIATLRLPSPPHRDMAPGADIVRRAMAAANRLGKPSAAFAFAMQFETSARQWDIVGRWVPLADPRPSVHIWKRKKWIGPTWQSIDGSIFEVIPSKTERTTGSRIRIDLRLCPLVIEALASIPEERRTGPLIVDDATGQPFRERMFGVLWRRIRAEAGLPAELWNRDLRAGAITEGGMAGASADDRAKQAGHSSPRTTRKVYDRDVLIGANRVAEARAKFRERS